MAFSEACRHIATHHDAIARGGVPAHHAVAGLTGLTCENAVRYRFVGTQSPFRGSVDGFDTRILVAAVVRGVKHITVSSIRGLRRTVVRMRRVSETLYL